MKRKYSQKYESYIIYCVSSWSGRGAHLRPMRFPKRAPPAMCATAQDAHIEIGGTRA